MLHLEIGGTSGRLTRHGGESSINSRGRTFSITQGDSRFEVGDKTLPTEVSREDL